MRKGALAVLLMMCCVAGVWADEPGRRDYRKGLLQIIALERRVRKLEAAADMEKPHQEDAAPETQKQKLLVRIQGIEKRVKALESRLDVEGGPEEGAEGLLGRIKLAQKRVDLLEKRAGSRKEAEETRKTGEAQKPQEPEVKDESQEETKRFSKGQKIDCFDHVHVRDTDSRGQEGHRAKKTEKGYPSKPEDAGIAVTVYPTADYALYARFVVRKSGTGVRITLPVGRAHYAIAHVGPRDEVRIQPPAPNQEHVKDCHLVGGKRYTVKATVTVAANKARVRIYLDGELLEQKQGPFREFLKGGTGVRLSALYGPVIWTKAVMVVESGHAEARK